MTQQPSISRLPPFDLNAERAALSSMILAGIADPIFDEMRATLARADFYSEDHQVVFAAVCSMKDAGRPIDFVTLRQHLDEHQQLKLIGGTEFLASLIQSMPSAAHGVHYASIVHELGRKRDLIRIANCILADAHGDQESVSSIEIAGKASAAIASAINSGRSIGYVTASQALIEAYEQIEKGDSALIPTGFRDLDSAIGGIGVGEMMIIGARPSMGKSTIARQIAMRVATKIPVALISLEESNAKIARNWISAAASIDNNRLRRGSNLVREEWDAVTAGISRMDRLPIYIASKAFGLQEVKSVATVLASKHGCKLVIVDYLQKIRCEGKDRYEKVTNASQELSSLWKDLEVAGLVLAQLKREVATRDDRRPSMTDLRESGQIEQDADSILLLHREDYYGASDPNYCMNHEAELIIAKMRDGERGRTIRLRSELNFQRFADIEQRPDLVNAFD